MSDDQELEPKPQSPGSPTPPTSPALPAPSGSGSGAKPAPPSGSLPRQSSDVAESHITWPVPHIILDFGGLELACGRKAIGGMGMMGFLEWVYRKFVWTPDGEYNNKYQIYYFERSKFAKEAVILGTFYNIYGASDTGLMLLSGLGWVEMIENVVKLKVFYEDNEGQGQPDKQG